MKRALEIFVYLLLLSVVVSSVRSIWIGVVEPDRYLDVFPGAKGALYWLTMIVSIVAGLNCIFIGLRKRWAIYVNPLIGVVSIIFIEVVGGPRINELVVLVASALTTILPWYLWLQPSDLEPADA